MLACSFEGELARQCTGVHYGIGCLHAVLRASLLASVLVYTMVLDACMRACTGVH
jgi:hypothetical protein